MAEFIFDLQLFADDTEDTTEDTTDVVDDVGGNGDGDGGEGSSGGSEGGGDTGGDSSSDNSSDNSSDAKNTVESLYGVQTVKNFVSKPGWETRTRNKGEIIFPMFMTIAEADVFSEYAYNNFSTALANGDVPYYDIQDGIANSVDYSRLLGSAVVFNDAYDTINLVDSNVGNIIEYYTYRNGNELSLVFDSGAILDFGIGLVSPWFNFANGENMIYSARQGQWLSGNEAEAEFVFWNTAIQYSGDDDYVENFAVTQGTNTAILNAGSSDTINLYDVTSSDVSYSINADNYTINLDSTEVTDSSITVYFPTGGALVVENSDEYSPIFNLADGTSYYYNRNRNEWRGATWDTIAALEASDAEVDAYNQAIADAYAKAVFEQALYEAGYDVVVEADSVGYAQFPLSIGNNNYVYDTRYYDTIYFADAFLANVVDYSADGAELNFTFNNGTTSTVEFDYNFSPIIQFADGTQIAYDYYTQTWGTPYYLTLDEDNLMLSRGADSIVYRAGMEDTIYFADALPANITSQFTNSNYINTFFDTGAVTNVRYTDYLSPKFVYADGSSYTYDLNAYKWIWGNVVQTGTDNVQDNFAVSVGNQNIIYNTGLEDGVYFLDATAANVASIEVDPWCVEFTFDNGMETSVVYTDMATPDFIFADGSTYYYSLGTHTWRTYDSEGYVDAYVTYEFFNYRDYSSDGREDRNTNTVVNVDDSSSGEAADLWGDTFSGTAAADEIFVGTVGNTLVQNVDAQDSVTFDATLSDIVATSVSDNTIAIAFGTGATAVIETAGTSPTFNLTSGESYIYDKQSASWKTA